MPIVLAEPSEDFLRIAAGQAAVYREYAALAAVAPLDAKSGPGGKLVFAGDLTQHSNLLRAANIAGAASLAASGDVVAGRAAMRDGVVDFLVTSLDEALRILKNEIRKRQPVSVSVGIAVEAVVAEMLARGVLPDLLASSACDAVSERQFRSQGSAVIPASTSADAHYTAWSVNQAGVRWLPHIDSCVRTVIPAGDVTRDRWLRVAPRYLGRAAQRQRGVPLSLPESERFRGKVEELAAASAVDADASVVAMLG